MRKRITTIMSSALCAVVLLGTLCVPAFAEIDPYYSGAVDTVTGEATDTAGSTASSIRISDTMYYDMTTHTFVYPTGSGTSEVRSNVADGMIISEPVSVTPDDGVEVSVNRNGTILEEVDLSNINLVGNYMIAVKGTDSTFNLFGFTIVGERANLSGGYVMPVGFYILDAKLDGEETYYERNYIGMEEEGLYEVEYICPDTAARYTLVTTIDHTPPQITLDGRLDKDGRYHSAVQVSGFQPGDSVAMLVDGEAQAFPSDGRLTVPGMYQLEIFDAAGNSTSEQFTILVYLDFNSLLFFALVCLSLAGVLGYVLFKRKKLKIV